MASAAQQVLRLGLGFIVSQALRVVADLEIADRLGDGPLSAEDLAEQTGADVGALFRILRLLASEGVFRETSPRHFELTELGAALRADAPYSARPMIRMMNRQPYLAFSELGHSVQTGSPAFDLVFGKPRFDWLAEHPNDAALFQHAMISFGQGDDEAVAEGFDFGRYTRVVDVGGGHGQLLSLILQRHPKLTGVLFDRPTGVAAARERGGPSAERIDFVGGDFFDAVPAGADVYVLKRVIHDWNDAKALAILKRCSEATPAHGRVLIVESLLKPGDQPDPMKRIDAVMLAVTGGLERTEEEYSALLEQAGLRLTRVHPTSRPLSILEATKTAI